MSWDTFLQEVADIHGLFDEDNRQVFLFRFAERNLARSHIQVAQDLYISEVTLQRRLGIVYAVFAPSCQALNSAKKGKFKILREWLKTEYIENQINCQGNRQPLMYRLSQVLHLSDLHFGTTDNARSWYAQLAEDLRYELNCSRLDALILSGDIASQSTPDQYAAAQLFISRLCQEFQLEPQQIVIVPGNHDLNWELAESAYIRTNQEDYQGELREGCYLEESGSVIKIRDEAIYKQRFAHFSRFYQEITGDNYPLEYDQQYSLQHLPEQNLLILGLNSAWQIDHHYPSRASINPEVISNVLSQIRRSSAYENCLKIAVWHHPVNHGSENCIKERGFMERFAAAGFRLCLHGGIHRAESSSYHYHYRTGGQIINIIGAGKFGVLTQERSSGYPWQYNLLKIEDSQLTVETRQRDDINGSWQPDARWFKGSEIEPMPRYIIYLDAANLEEHELDVEQGKAYAESGRYEEAIACYKSALQFYTREAFSQEWAEIQQSLGQVYSERIQGDKAENIDEAIACFQAALEIYTRETFPEQWAMTQNSLGEAYSHKIKRANIENRERAIASYEAALQVYTRESSPQQWVKAQNNLGDAYMRRLWGDLTENTKLAIRSYEQALVAAREISDRSAEAHSLEKLGHGFSHFLREDQRAKDYYQQFLGISEEIGDRVGIGNALNCLGNVYSSLEEFQQAIEYYQQSLAIFEEIDDRSGISDSLYNLSRAYDSLGESQRAKDYEQLYLAISDGISDRAGEQLALLQNDSDERVRRLARQLYQAYVSAYQTLVQESNLVYGISLTIFPEATSVGGDIEVSISLKSVGEVDERDYMFQLPKSEAIGSELNILLNAPGFQLDGDNTASLPLDPDANGETITRQLTQTATFRLTALRSDTTTITAELYRGDTFETTLKTQVQVAEFDTTRFTPKRITTQPRPVPQPDFILRIQTAGNDTHSACQFQYQLRSFRIPSLFPGEINYHSEFLSSRWLEQMRGLLGTTLETISDALPEDGRSRLMSLGQYLFTHLLPRELQNDLHTVTRLNRTFTLLILADQDSALPWELLHDGERFLSDRFIIGRWFWELNPTRPHEFPVGAIHVAHYNTVEQPELWTDLLEPPGAPPALPLPDGVLSHLDSTTAMRGLHLIRYSLSDATNRQNAPVRLDNGNQAQDIDRQIRPAKLNLRRHRPLVSLGSVRQDQPELIPLEQTWASAFIRAGCSAFTGSLWAVNPAVEAAFISSFYHRLWMGDSLGEAFQASRHLARAAVPDSLDWLSYVLFGDPMARPYRPVEGKGYAVVEPIGRDIDEPLPPNVPVRFRLSLRRTPPVWHEERVIEVAETLTFDNLQAHVKTFGLQVTPDSPITMNLAPTGNYLGWFTLVAPPEMVGNSALVQVFLMDGILPIHSLMFSLTIAAEGGD
jgi:tetratricopeptide (TPR) repeat protein